MSKNVKEKIREVFLENLPRNKGGNKIVWAESVGYKVRFIYEDIEGWLEIMEFNSKTKHLHIKYLDEVFELKRDNLARGMIGRVLGKGIRTPSDFELDIYTKIKDTKRDIVIINREHRKNKRGVNQKWYKYRCSRCGYEGYVRESTLLKNNSGCIACINQAVQIGYNDIPTIAPWMIKYFQGGEEEAKLYVPQSNKKIYPICPDCGRVKTKPVLICGLYNQRSINCLCNESGRRYPEKLMISILEQLGIGFEEEYNPKWCKYIDFNNTNKIKTGRYDFLLKDTYIDNKQVIIEMDGRWHKEYNNLSGQTAEESKYIDDMKDKLAKEHGIEVIRIDCDYGNKDRLEFIKQNILSSMIIRVLHLENIDWKRADEFITINRVKEACCHWESGIHSTKEIARIMNLHMSTINNYLKKGSGIWCNYNSLEQRKIGEFKAGNAGNNKPIEIFKDNGSIGIFDSIKELVEQSEILFNVRLEHQGIAKVCKGKRTQYKGFTFKFISKEEYKNRINNKEDIN